MLSEPIRVTPGTELIFTLPDTTTVVDLEYISSALHKHFAGRRVLVIRGDVTVTPIERRHTRPYRPSLLAHGGRG